MKKHKAEPSCGKLVQAKPIVSWPVVKALVCFTGRAKRWTGWSAAIGCPDRCQTHGLFVSVSNCYCCCQQHQGSYNGVRDFHLRSPNARRGDGV